MLSFGKSQLVKPGAFFGTQCNAKTRQCTYRWWM